MQKDRTATLSMAPHLGDFVHQAANGPRVTPARTANYHYAEMRCAEQTARSLSARHSAHIVLGGLTGMPWEQVTEIAAVRDSYYRLAAAYRAAGRRRERREARAEALADFIDRPVFIAGVYVRSYARDVRRIAGRIRRAVSA